MTSAANLNFFAAEADQKAILDFLFTHTDIRVFESYSKPDAELREFRSVDEVAAAFSIGNDERGNGYAVLLELWSPSVMTSLDVVRFALNPNTCDGHTFRYRIDGGGLMQLHFGGVCGRVVTKSHFGHQSLTRAAAWGTDGGVHWDALKRLSTKIRYHLNKRLAVGKVPGCPVLAQAMQLAQSGYELKLATQTPWKYELVAG